MNYAAPGDGVPSMELRSTFTGAHHPANPNIRRSAIMHQLSVLVGLLDLLSPETPKAVLVC